MQKALVTGASGFLGKYIVQELSKQYVVHTLGRQADADYHADISTEIPQVNSSYDLVVHAAAKAHKISATSEEAADFFEVNENGSRRLCEAFDQSKFYPKHWVFISTGSCVWTGRRELIKETEPLNGLTPYARSKINAEKILTGWCSEHGVKLTILRLPLIAGPNPPGNLRAL
jgi:nucleoside-diphosphate-sugar epimerase